MNNEIFQPLVPSQEEVARGIANGVIASVNTNASQLIQEAEATFSKIWHPGLGVTPQQVFNQFGTKAATLFVMFSAYVTYIQTMKPDYVPPTPPNTFTINQDGTVTVTS